MKSAVFAFSKLIPLTGSHRALVDTVMDIAQQKDAEPRIYLSHSAGKNDPLPYKTKITLAEQSFGSLVKQSRARNIIEILKTLQQERFSDVTVVVDNTDSVNNFQLLLDTYNHRDVEFATINVVSANIHTSKLEESTMSPLTHDQLFIERLSEDDRLDDDDMNFPSDKETSDQLNDMDDENLDPEEDDVDMLDILMPEDFDDEDVDVDDKVTGGTTESYRVMDIPQRVRAGQKLRSRSARMTRMRKLMRQRMPSSARLSYRSRKAALLIMKRRAAGRRNLNYGKMSRAQRMIIDMQLKHRFGKSLVAVINRLSKRIMPIIRRTAQASVARARGQKSMSKPLGASSLQLAHYDRAFIAEVRDENPDDTGNIMVGMRKSISLRGYPFTFDDGAKVSIEPSHAHRALDAISSLRTPIEKHALMKELSRSHAHFKKALRLNIQEDSVAVDDNKPRKIDPKLDFLMRLGLVDTNDLQKYRLALRSGKKTALQSPQMREKLADLLDKLIVLTTKDPVTYNRVRQKVQAREDYDLDNKAKKSGINVKTLNAVFERELGESNNLSRAYSRVDSFISGGAAAKLDADLINEVERASDTKTILVKTPEGKTVVRNVKRELRVAEKKKSVNSAFEALEVGTDAIRTAYSNATPGQSPQFVVAPYSVDKPVVGDRADNTPVASNKSVATFKDVRKALAGVRDKVK